MQRAKIISGVGAGEGLAAVRGNQSGAEGAAVAMPTLSREIEAWNLVDIPLPGANSILMNRVERIDGGR